MTRQIRHGTPTAYMDDRCRCDECKAWKRAKDRAYYERHREQVKARTAAYYEANRAEIAARRAEDFAALPEDEKEKVRRAKRPRTPEQRAKAYLRTRRYAQTPKGRAAFLAAKLKRRSMDGLSGEAKAFLPVLLMDPCSYCGGLGGEIDHIHPVTHGGDGEIGNLAASCRSCNAKKNSQSLLEFLLRKAA